MKIFQKIAGMFKRKAMKPEDEKHVKYMSWWRSYKPVFTNKKPTLQRVYIDNDGNNYYLITDTLQMSEERGAAIDSAIQASDYNMTAKERAARARKNIETANKIDAANGDVEKIARLTRSLREREKDTLFRMTEMPREELLIEIALLLYVIDGENPLQVNSLTQNKKRDLVAKDNDLRAFFLKTCYERFKSTTSDGGLTFLRYLEEQNKLKHRKRQKKRHGM